MIEVSLSLIGQKVKKNIAENSFALGHETHNTPFVLQKNWMETNNVGVHSQTNSDIPVQLIITTPDWVSVIQSWF